MPLHAAAPPSIEEYISPLWRDLLSFYDNEKQTRRNKQEELTEIQPVFKSYVKRKLYEGIFYTCLLRKALAFRNDQKTNKNEGIEDKYRIMDSIYDMLHLFDQGGSYRSQMQIEVHNMVVSICSRIVFGQFFDAYKKDIMDRYNYEPIDIYPVISIITPRRCGKTVSIAIAATVLLVCVPNVEIAIFSKVLEQCIMMMDKIKFYLNQQFPHIYSKLSKKNDQHIFYQPTDKDIRKIHAYPSGVDVRFFMFVKRKEKTTNSTIIINVNQLNDWLHIESFLM
jgi:hypothetical protein